MKIKFKPFRLLVILLAIIALVSITYMFVNRNSQPKLTTKAVIIDHEPIKTFAIDSNTLLFDSIPRTIECKGIHLRKQHDSSLQHP